MPKPTLAAFRAEPTIHAPFIVTSNTVVQAALDAAYYDHGFTNKRAAIYAAAHLLAIDADDSKHLGVKMPELAVDLGTGGGLAADVMDGGRRTISTQGAGAQPGVAAGAQDDVFWSLDGLRTARARSGKAPSGAASVSYCVVAR